MKKKTFEVRNKIYAKMSSLQVSNIEIVTNNPITTKGRVQKK